MSDTTAGADQQRREARATRVAAGAFLIAIVAGIALTVVYVTGGQTQLEGVLLFLGFGGVGLGLGVWAKVLVDEPEVTEERPTLTSTRDEREAFEATLHDDVDAGDPARRRLLSRLLVGAGASLALALILPFRSLGPGPAGELFDTAWRRGARLVNPSGRPIRPGDLAVGEIVTVFPQDEVGSADAQAVLIAVADADLELPDDAPETVSGLVCYSKLCTHAGCPVGLYRSEVHELLCPCHQSTFDVRRGARPLSGPAVRPLPQLPIGTDSEGYLIALGGFNATVGPSFWNMERER